ncbi:MAG: hypothetical protein V4495_25370 [Pseudomonadota bacterium]
MTVSATACWAESLTLAGKIGTSPVVMELNLDKDNVQGRYFYRKHHLDLPLEGQVRSDGSLALTEGAAGSGAVKAELLLRPGPHGEWHGSWKDRLRTTALPVQLSSLTILPAKSVQSGEVTIPKLSTYERERLQGLPLRRDTADATDTAAHRQLQWWVEPVSGVRAFRFETGYDAAVLGALNARLAQEQTTAIVAFFACQLNYSRRYGSTQAGDFSFRAEPRLISTTLVSMRFSTTSTCDSGGVSILGSSMNAQIPGLHELELSQVIWGQDDKHAAGEPALPAWIANAMHNLHGTEMADLKERCKFKDEDIWHHPAWSLTTAGVILEPAFSPDKQGPCGGEWLLPWDMVKFKPGR